MELSRRSFVGAAGAAALGVLGAANLAAAPRSAMAEAAEPKAEAEVTQRTVYVTPEWLAAALAGEVEGYENVLVCNVAYPMAAADYPGYAEHIPGAIYVSIMEVEDAVGDEQGLYNLLPAEQIADYCLAHGITKDTKVVLYGDDPSGVGRQAYGYIFTGVADVKILNGGLAAWTAAGYETQAEANEGTPAEEFGCEVPAHPEYWVSLEDTLDRLANDENFKLVSIRSEQEWLGKTSGYSYMDKAGEPEGAVWGKGPLTAADVAMFTNEDGTVKTLAELEQIWADCDFTLENHLSFYCGTGWRATVPFLVLYGEGYDNISVFDGGWYECLFNEDYPVQVGDPASPDCIHTTVGELPGGMAATN